MEELQKPEIKTIAEQKHSPAASKFLEMAIKRYQFDVVGWTEYCLDNADLDQKILPVYRQKPLGNLRIQEKMVMTYSTPPLESIYGSRENYILWLKEEYAKDQAFYEAILKDPSKLMVSLGLEPGIEPKDMKINEEIDKSAADYLKVIERKKIDEKAIIEKIHNEDWLDIKMSKYPKVQLGIVLGAAPESIVNNFCVYFLNQLKGHFAGGRTAFLSSTGPASWHELDECKGELTHFREQALRPCLKELE